MADDGITEVLRQAADAAARYREGVGDRRVPAELDVHALRGLVDADLAPKGEPAVEVVRDLAELGERGTVATTGPRYFGFVTGGTLPAAVGADVLAAAWDQNAGLAVLSPLASVLEERAGAWILDLLGLPASGSIGFVTGGQMANTTCLLVGRDHVLGAAGWDVRAAGLTGAPKVHVLVGEERHTTVDASLRTLGLGAPDVLVPVDDQGRMRPDALATALADLEGPTIVALQAGHIVSGAFDPFAELIPIAHEHGAWVHVDGAFGGWAAASPRHRARTEGMAGADSWAVDGHKVLNVPYDCGYAMTAHPASHRTSCLSTASYLVSEGGADAPRDGLDWTLDLSRRARGVPSYAALRSLGRDGVGAMVDRLGRMAERFAERLQDEPGIDVVNDVVFDQCAVRFGDDDAHTAAVIAAVQDEGTCWAGPATWKGKAVMRLSVSSWATTEADVDRSAEAIVRCHRAVTASA
jgi:glutamate/tyrosine decarboxylase-like PLP-dependent enzyme